MNISLAFSLACLKFSIHVARTHLEKSVNQKVDIVLLFVLLYVEDGTLQNSLKIPISYPFLLENEN